MARDAKVEPPGVQQRDVGAVHDPLRPNVHPAACRHLSIVGHAQLGGLVEVGGVVEFAHHEPVGVDHSRSIPMAGEQAHRVPRCDHKRLRVRHLREVLTHQPILHPILEDLARLPVSDEFVRIERYSEVQVVVDVELKRSGFKDASILADGPRFDVAVRPHAFTAGLRTKTVAVDAAPLP